MADTITILLALEARDKATQIVDAIVGKVKGYETAVKAAASTSVASSAEIEAANTKAAASTASYERAVAGQTAAQAGLRESMLASKAAQMEYDAAVREGSVSVRAAAAQVTAAVDAEEAALMRLQKSEQLAATRSKEMAEAQKAASTESTASGMSLKGLAIGAGATALAVGYIGDKAIKAAADFQSSTTRLITSAGEIHSNIDGVRQGMLQMAGDVGYSTDALSKAMYKVESGGQHGAAGLQVLRAAAEGAKTENADLTTVADAVTTVLVDYHKGAGDAADVTSRLVAATSAGKTTFEELSGSLHSVLPNASAAHISLNDVLGDLAAMTVHGMSAQQAAQNLNDVIRHMQAPTAVQAKELAVLGMNTNQLADDLKTKGLSGTLQEISGRIMKLSPPGTDKVILDLKTALNGLSPAVRELGMHLFDGSMSAKEYNKAAGALDPISQKQAISFSTLAGSMHRIGDVQTSGANVMQNYGQALYKATGDATGLNTALMLSGENAGVTNGAIKTVADAATEAGNHVRGWSDIQGTFNYKMDALKGKAEAAKIAIGTGLLPVVTAIASKVISIVGPIAEWTVHHQQLSAIILGSIGGISALVILIIGAIKAFEMVKTAILGVRLAMVFLKLATLETNGAFAMSPLGWIVIILAAVALAVYYCWTHFASFRKIVIECWDGIKVAAMATWNDVLKPTFEGIKIAIMQGVVPAALWMWHNVLEPAWKGIAAAAQVAWAIIKVIFDIFVAGIKGLAVVAMWLWHNVLEPVWKGISVAIAIAWAIIKPIWAFIQLEIKGLAIIFTWLWHNIIQPVWMGIQIAISIAWAIIQVIFGIIQIEIKILAAIFTWLWQNVVQPVWQGIQLAISIAWAAIQVILGLIQIEIKGLAIIFTWLWQNVIQPVWQGIAAVISWAWNNIVKPLWEGAKMDIRILGAVFSWLYDNVIKPVWNAIGSAISWVWNSVVKPVFNLLGGFIKDFVVPAFKSGVDAIGSAWHGLIDIAKMPVRFVVNTILNDGLLAAYNAVAKTFGVHPDNVHIPLPAGFAAGGQIPGAPSTTDNILAMVATGEYVMPTNQTRRYLPLLESMRAGTMPLYPGDGAALGIPGYAGGGLVGAITNIGAGIWDLFTDPAKLLRGPAEQLINSIPGAGKLRDLLVGGSHKLLDGLLSWVKGSGGQGDAGRAMAFLRAQDGKPYVWASAGPGGYDCSGIVSAVYNALKGQNPFQHTFSTSNEAPYFPLSGPGGVLTAGWTNPGEPGPGGNSVGHTAGVLAGLPFESTGPGVRMGAGVTPVSSFAHVGHFDSGGPLYPGWTAAYNGTGKTEWVNNPHGGSGAPTVVIDLRESKFMTDRDIDHLLDRIDKRLVRTLLPGAGVQVRR